MTLETTEYTEPRGHVRVVYLGPVAPHWDIQGLEGDRAQLDEFRARAIARLQYLPPHDPQFRRNRERVIRDAEREAFTLDWDLGYDEDEETDLGARPS
jgi:predicted DNA-binding transcriptional regulator YafY